MGHKTSSPASVFETVLRAFETGDIAYTEVLAQLNRVLVTGASPTELLEILRRRESIEPMPEYAHVQVLGVLTDAIARAAAQNADADTAPGQNPDSVSAPTRSMSMAPPIERADGPPKATIVSLTSLRHPDLTSMATPNRTTPDSVAAATPMSVPGPGRSAAVGESAAATRIRTLPPVGASGSQLASTPSVPSEFVRRNAESAAVARATALAAELAAARTALESEQSRAQKLDKALAESIASTQAARSHGEEALRESERSQTESRALRESLAAREAQLAALQQEHAKTVPALEARAKLGTQLEADLQAARARADAIALELKASRDGAAVVTAQLKRGESLLNAARTELDAVKTQSSCYLELLRTREWRRGTAQNTFRELDARVDAADVGRAALQAERDHLQAQVASLQTKLEASDALVDKVRTAAGSDAQRVAELQAAAQLRESEQAATVAQLHAQHAAQIAQLRSMQAAQIAEVESAQAVRAERSTAVPTLEPSTNTPSQPSAVEAEVTDEDITIDLDKVDHFSEEPIPSAAGAVQDAVAVGDVLTERHPSVAPIGEGGSSRVYKATARAVWLSAAVFVVAVVVWLFIHRAPVSTQVPSSSAAAPNPVTVIHDCPTCPAMTVLSAGRFKQGSARAESASFEKPLHWVAVERPFAMSTNAVTVDEFAEFIAATGRDMQGCDTYDGEWKPGPKNSWKDPGFVQTGTHPVTCASWNDAKAYAQWLSTETGHRYRLPSASEWEYAARAGSEAAQPWNPDGSGVCANANVADLSAGHRYPGWLVFACDDGYVYTAPVGSFKANSFGLNDMLGNVFQWTEDCWHADYTGAPIDASARTDGNCSEHELRGGSWFTTPTYVRANYRNHFAADYRTSTVGIRLVRDIEN